MLRRLYFLLTSICGELRDCVMCSRIARRTEDAGRARNQYANVMSTHNQHNRRQTRVGAFSANQHTWRWSLTMEEHIVAVCTLKVTRACWKYCISRDNLLAKRGWVKTNLCFLLCYTLSWFYPHVSNVIYGLNQHTFLIPWSYSSICQTLILA